MRAAGILVRSAGLGGCESAERGRDGRTDSAASGGAPAAGAGVPGAARPWPGPRSGCRAPPPGAGAAAGTRPEAPRPKPRAETVCTDARELPGRTGRAQRGGDGSPAALALRARRGTPGPSSSAVREAGGRARAGGRAAP